MKINHSEILLELGDITNLKVDAIVNAANTGLLPGGGVCGAIHDKGGSTIFDECSKIGHCPEGSAVITGGGSLYARYVIHAVGPSGGNPDRKEKLTKAVTKCLELCDLNDIKTIAFPAISTGIFGYPVPEACEVMISATLHYLKGKTMIEKVIFCLYEDAVHREFSKALKRLTDNL